MKLALRYKILLFIVLPLVLLLYLPTICLPYLTGLNKDSRLLYNELIKYAIKNDGYLPKSDAEAVNNTNINTNILKEFGFAYNVDLNTIEKKEPLQNILWVIKWTNIT